MSHPDALRVPPHSVEAETALLGGLLLQGKAFADVADAVAAADFYRRENRLVWEAMAALDDAGRPIDVVAVIEQLRTTERLEDAGGMEYVATLAREAVGAANVRHYAEIVRAKALLRAAVKAGMDIVQAAMAGSDPAEVLELAQTAVMEIGDVREGGPELVGDLLRGWLDVMDQRAQAGSTLRGLATGFTDFDALTHGLTAGQLVVLAGRPAMGKTTLAMNIAEHVALREGKPVAVFEMEMDRGELMDRLVSSVARLELEAVRTANMSDEQWALCTAAAGKLKAAPLIVDDTPGLTVAEIRARARRIQQRHGLALVVVDYLQLIESKGKSDNRTDEVTKISRGLKKLAKALRVPVIALSQLNRSLESRPDKRPIMADLRESGAIEQDADIIAFIYRDEVYHEATEDDDPRRNIAELIVAKQRNGRTGKVLLTADLARSRFNNCHAEAQSRYREVMKPKQPERKYAKGGFDDL